jgi:hypothetical protein
VPPSRPNPAPSKEDAMDKDDLPFPQTGIVEFNLKEATMGLFLKR